jgi:8-oxo-dGTP diphosphatase
MKTEVKAAGGVVRRRGADGVRFALVHRPRYDGDPAQGQSEDDEDREDTRAGGCWRRPGSDANSTGDRHRAYTDHLGRPKVVHYWLMYPAEGVFIPGDEVDELRWVTAEEARELLTYGHDRVVLDAAIAFDRPIYLVRHAKAGDRDAWTENDDRGR